jgi:hypothetical protein
MKIKIILIDYIGRVSSRSMSMMAEKSKSVPFLDAPKNLNGLVGDKGMYIKYYYHYHSSPSTH